MSDDLIRREDVLKEACCGIWDIPRSEIEGVLKHIPIVDAVEVVRCKDCKLWDPDPDTYGDSIGPKGKCMKSFETMICDDFCSYGERRADDAD